MTDADMSKATDDLAKRLLRWRYRASTLYEIPVSVVEAELQDAREEALEIATSEQAELLAALREARLLAEEITDLEGREGMTDSDFAEQVIALAQEKLQVFRAALPPDPAPETLPTATDEQLATQFCIDAAELPDRTSPDDYPDHLLITPEELTSMLLEAFAEVRAETIRALRASLLPREEPS